MGETLAFDVYGTLVDTSGITRRLHELVGERAAAFAAQWREKQLEYAFRRGLMRRFEDFSVCVRDSLEFTCRSFGLKLPAAERDALLAGYRELPAFADAAPALVGLKSAGFELHAFSNGSAATVTALLRAAAIDRCFRSIVSVEAVQSFKPDPAVYRYFVEQTGADGESVWLVSANPFDVIGARAAGLNGIWVRRSPDTVFDPWGIEPTLSVTALTEIAAAIADYRSQ